MKIVIVNHRSEDHGPDDFAPYLTPEAKKAFELMDDGFIRELYSRQDGNGAVLIVEAENEDDARARMADLPLVKAGLLRCEYYPVKAFRALKAAADLL
ncbi:MAG: YciI family protein [Alphaproteobacteria bacterium]|nr:YciI family protein [Alphaproteobacteria bacterium]